MEEGEQMPLEQIRVEQKKFPIKPFVITVIIVLIIAGGMLTYFLLNSSDRANPDSDQAKILCEESGGTYHSCPPCPKEGVCAPCPKPCECPIDGKRYDVCPPEGLITAELKEGVVYVFRSGEEIKKIESIQGYNYINLSPNKKYVAYGVGMGDGIIMKMYDIESDTIYEVDIIVSTMKDHEWLEDNRYQAYQGCVVAGPDSCLKFQSVSSDTPWVLEKVIDTSSWNTYKSETYGFEFKYPREIAIHLSDKDGKPSQKITSTITITKRDDGITIKSSEEVYYAGL